MIKLLTTLAEVFQGIGHTLSAFVNTIFLKGDMYTSMSARCHMETYDSEGKPRENPPSKWVNMRKWINRVFFWQEDHCKTAWETDYQRAFDKFFAHMNL